MQNRTTEMAAGLTNHLWSLAEWLTFPTLRREWATRLFLKLAENDGQDCPASDAKTRQWLGSSLGLPMTQRP